MASTLFIIEKEIKIRNELQLQPAFLLGGADRHRPNGSASWVLEFRPVMIFAHSDQQVSGRNW